MNWLVLGGKAMDVNMWFKVGQRGCRVLVVDGYSYNRNRQTDEKTYWICSRKVRKQIFQLIFLHIFSIKHDQI